jgi:hypothetical protein
MIDNHDIQDAKENLDSIKTRNDTNADEEVLFAALSLYTWAGMKKKEITAAKFKDIVYDGDDIVGIKTNGNDKKYFIRLFGHPKQVLRQYLHYMSDSHNRSPDTTPDLPLFPGYDGQSGERKLSRHIKKLGEGNNGLSCTNEWKLSYLRDVGMVDYYNNLIENDFSAEQALQRTAEQFRMTESQTYKRIKGVKYRVPPNNYDKFLAHCFETETLDFTNDRKVKSHEEKGLSLIDKIRCSSDDKKSYHETFQNVLSRERENFLRKQSEKKEKTPKLSCHEELRKKLDELTPTEENPSIPYFDRIESMWRDDCNDKDDQEKSNEDDQENPDKN